MVSCYGIEGRWGSDSLVGELGVYIGEKRYWSHGYGRDAVATFLGHLFNDLGFCEVYLHTYESNVRAQKSYLRVGFEAREKRRRFSTRVGYHQELRMDITRERFNQLQRGRVPALT
jgi:RimJ/RimL family protein N-acetyltransferase